MNKSEIKVYPYRWVILAIYFLISVIIEFQRLTFTLGSDEFFVHPESRYFSI